MNALSGVHANNGDEVDTLIEALIKDPSKAEDIKAALRNRVKKPQVVALEKASAPKRDDINDEDTSDMWDNVPV